MGAQNHFERVRALVSRETGLPEGQITPETRLVEDLRIDGDDGHDLLEAFADEFRVDMGNIAELNYFDDEPPLFYSSVLIPVAALISPRFAAFARRATRGRRRVTVRDLIASARAGRWLRPEVPREDADVTRFDIRTNLYLTGTVVLPALFGLWRYAISGDSLGGAVKMALIVFAVVWVISVVKFLLSIPWLKRLDAAAGHEESAGITAED